MIGPQLTATEIQSRRLEPIMSDAWLPIADALLFLIAMGHHMKFIDKESGDVAEAIRFIEADKRTHWYVNFARMNRSDPNESPSYWVQGALSKMPISDGDYVVKYEGVQTATVVKAEYFFGQFEVVPE
jgi:hypothetical protein